ncbi:unnamed protein product [Boreogadus saida]
MSPAGEGKMNHTRVWTIPHQTWSLDTWRCFPAHAYGGPGSSADWVVTALAHVGAILLSIYDFQSNQCSKTCF